MDDPASLGTTLTQYDSDFIEEGHRRGVMPQLLKAIATVETSTLNPMAYRYEPFWDKTNLSQFGMDLRERQAPYNQYRLATLDGFDANGNPYGLPAGIYLSEVSLAPRSKYFIYDDVGARPIQASDQYVSALSIIYANDIDAIGVLAPGVHPQNWISKHKWTQIEFWNHIDKFGFTAQTSLAASYGLMQILYTTAIRPLNWTGGKPSGACYSQPQQCSPDLLFDTEQNRANGLGSLSLAGAVVARGIEQNNSALDFTNQVDYEAAIASGLTDYNQDSAYPNGVLEKLHQIVPVAASTSIIQ